MRCWKPLGYENNCMGVTQIPDVVLGSVLRQRLSRNLKKLPCWQVVHQCV